MDFEPTGDLLTDFQSAIDTQTVISMEYTDRYGDYTTRNVAPLEIRGDRVYCWDLDKNGLRLFILGRIGNFTVMDQTFDKESFS